jgi:hypothetical protein
MFASFSSRLGWLGSIVSLIGTVLSASSELLPKRGAEYDTAVKDSFRRPAWLAVAQREIMSLARKAR